MTDYTQYLIDVINAVKNSVDDANNNLSQLNNEILMLCGFSGIKTRHLLNNLCKNLSIVKKIKYVEVGTWMGSTLISASYKNYNMYVYGIDNWSEFNENNSGTICKENINKLLTLEKENITIVEKDCFSINKDDININTTGLIDFYMFDGYHTYDTQKDAITKYKQFFADIFVVYIDDWSWERVQKGTFDGFKESNIEILYKIEDFSDQENGGKDTYWNGFGLFICRNN